MARRKVQMKPRCKITGCKNVVRSIGRHKDGSPRLGSICDFHHKEKYGMPYSFTDKRKMRLGEFVKCVLCGWDGPCDIHRIIPGVLGGKYTIENIQSVCPNCHRLLHLGASSKRRVAKTSPL